MTTFLKIVWLFIISVIMVVFTNIIFTHNLSNYESLILLLLIFMVLNQNGMVDEYGK